MNNGINEGDDTAAFGRVRKCDRNTKVAAHRLHHHAPVVMTSACKRARTQQQQKESSLSWQDFVVVAEQQPWGLQDLFGTCSHDFYTLQLQHRQGGALAKHAGEERILLFRHDRPGAIAKVIFSSSLAADDNHHHGDEEQNVAALATIHVLDVKEPYRGMNLGSLLCTQALDTLRHRYSRESQQEQSSPPPPPSSSSRSATTTTTMTTICCQLHAEEDSRRHGKLVQFYQNLGFHVKPRAKVQYINHNDGETYRKVAMQRAINVDCHRYTPTTAPRDEEFTTTRQQEWHYKDAFLFIAIEGHYKEQVCLNDHNRFLLVDRGNGRVQLRTTLGEAIVVCPSGTVEIMASNDEGSSSSRSASSQFHLVRLADTKASTTQSFGSNKDAAKAREARLLDKGLWLLQSSHGAFLAVDEYSSSLVCTKRPSFWRAMTTDGKYHILQCTRETPLCRWHYLRKWATQSVDFVRSMRKKYLRFEICSMTLEQALEKAMYIDVGISEHATAADCPSPSLRSVCFRIAEWFRRHGESDWMQLLGLVYCLGRVIKVVEPRPQVPDDSRYDWTIPSQGWVLGCAPPASVVFSEFSGKSPDRDDPRYNSQQGMYDAFCGFDQVLTTWSSQEYISELFRYNKVDLPEEAFAMLRLASVRDWHTKGSYGHLSEGKDDDLAHFVADFDEILEQAMSGAMERPELAGNKCRRLWCNYYRAIAEKYGADGVLCW